MRYKMRFPGLGQDAHVMMSGPRASPCASCFFPPDRLMNHISFIIWLRAHFPVPQTFGLIRGGSQVQSKHEVPSRFFLAKLEHMFSCLERKTPSGTMWTFLVTLPGPDSGDLIWEAGHSPCQRLRRSQPRWRGALSMSWYSRRRACREVADKVAPAEGFRQLWTCNIWLCLVVLSCTFPSAHPSRPWIKVLIGKGKSDQDFRCMSLKLRHQWLLKMRKSEVGQRQELSWHSATWMVSLPAHKHMVLNVLSTYCVTRPALKCSLAQLISHSQPAKVNTILLLFYR